MQITEKVIKVKQWLLELAQQLGNVSKACQIMGSSRGSLLSSEYYTLTSVGTADYQMIVLTFRLIQMSTTVVAHQINPDKPKNEKGSTKTKNC